MEDPESVPRIEPSHQLNRRDKDTVMDRHEQHASHPHRGNGHDLHARQDAERFLQAHPISIGVKAVLAAQEVISKPVQQIAEDLGKKNGDDITPYEVMMATSAALPKAVGKAVFEASLEQVEAWQMTMLKSFQPGKFFSLSDR
jgi:hypothetical protein